MKSNDGNFFRWWPWTMLYLWSWPPLIDWLVDIIIFKCKNSNATSHSDEMDKKFFHFLLLVSFVIFPPSVDEVEWWEFFSMMTMDNVIFVKLASIDWLIDWLKAAFFLLRKKPGQHGGKDFVFLRSEQKENTVRGRWRKKRWLAEEKTQVGWRSKIETGLNVTRTSANYDDVFRTGEMVKQEKEDPIGRIDACFENYPAVWCSFITSGSGGGME